jgi:hypothetical protein
MHPTGRDPGPVFCAIPARIEGYWYGIDIRIVGAHLFIKIVHIEKI